MKQYLLGLAVGVALGMRLSEPVASAPSPILEGHVEQERPTWKPWPRLLFWITFSVVVAVGVGVIVGAYAQDAAAFADRDQLASGLFALAGVLGTMGGFVAAAAVFVGSASGSILDEFWREHGEELAILLGVGVVTLFLGAVTIAGCGVFVDGWFARGLALGVLALCLVHAIQIVRLVTLVLFARATERGNT